MLVDAYEGTLAQVLPSNADPTVASIKTEGPERQAFD